LILVAAVLASFNGPPVTPARDPEHRRQQRANVIAGQLARYSPEAFLECDRASAAAGEVARGRYARSINLASALPVEQSRRAKLAQQIAELSTIRQNIDSGLADRDQTSLQEIEDVSRRLSQIETELQISPDLALADSEHTQSELDFFDAKLRQALLSEAWLALSRLSATRALESGAQKSEAISRALRAAENAAAQVTPWCEAAQFSRAYVQQRNLSLLQSCHSRDWTKRAQAVLVSHRRALSALLARVGTRGADAASSNGSYSPALRAALRACQEGTP
jgi:hypothetical protein